MPIKIKPSFADHVQAASWCVTQNNGQTISNSTVTIINFDQIIEDPLNGFNNSTNYFTVPISGFYQLNAQALMAVGSVFDAGESMRMYMYQGGSLMRQMSTILVPTDSSTAHTNFVHVRASGIDYFTAGTGLTARLWQNTGVNQFTYNSSTSAGANTWTSFSGCLLTSNSRI